MVAKSIESGYDTGTRTMGEVISAKTSLAEDEDFCAN
jgi:hypothetical protein